MADDDEIETGQPTFGLGAPTRRVHALQQGSLRRAQVSLKFGRYVDVPGEPALGGGASLDEIGTHTAINTIDQAYSDTPLAIPQKMVTEGDVRAIAIAADSPMATLDLWLGDATIANRNRIAPGRPWIGSPGEADNVLVTLPRSCPDPFDSALLAGETAAQFAASNVVWDTQSGVTPGTTGPATGTRVEYVIPVRLELYRGEIVPFYQRKRAPYHAALSFSQIADGTGTTYQRLWQITDGRDITEICVRNNGVNDLDITIVGHDSVLPTKGGVGTANQFTRGHVFTAITGPTTLAAAGGGTSYKFICRDPYQLISVMVQPHVAGTGGAPKPIFGSINMTTRDT